MVEPNAMWGVIELVVLVALMVAGIPIAVEELEPVNHLLLHDRGLSPT